MKPPCEQVQAGGARTVAHAMREDKVSDEGNVEVLHQRQHVKADACSSHTPHSLRITELKVPQHQITLLGSRRH